MAEIATHLNLAPEGSVLMLQGPGGVGKSTVLAKFILDAVEKSPCPPTVMVLNLDDPQLGIDDPFTLLQEAGRQLRIQHPDLNPRLDEMRGYIASLQRRSRSMEVFESVSGGTVEWSAVTQIAREIMALIPGQQPVLLVIDTFEEAQTTGPSAVNRLLQLVESLRSGNPRLSVVIAWIRWRHGRFWKRWRASVPCPTTWPTGFSPWRRAIRWPPIWRAGSSRPKGRMPFTATRIWRG